MTPKVKYPEISDTVIYKSLGSADGRYKPEDRSAIVTEIHVDEFINKDPKVGANYNEYTVSLCVFNPTGLFFNTFVQYDPEGKPGTWRYKGGKLQPLFVKNVT